MVIVELVTFPVATAADEFASVPEAFPWNVILPLPCGSYIHVKLAVPPLPAMLANPGVWPLTYTAPPLPLSTNAAGVTPLAAVCPKFVTTIITVIGWPMSIVDGVFITALKLAGDSMSICALEVAVDVLVVFEYAAYPVTDAFTPSVPDCAARYVHVKSALAFGAIDAAGVGALTGPV
jgi:hypothetical protein